MQAVLSSAAASLALAVLAVWGAPSEPEATAGTEREVLDVQARRFRAIVDADIEALRTILSDDLTYIHTTGRIESKSEFLDSLRSRAAVYHSIEPREVRIRIYGHAVLVTGIVLMQVNAGERRFSFSARFTEVYRSEDGVWRLLAWQSTRLPET